MNILKYNQTLASYAELREAPEYSTERMIVFNSAACTMLNKVLNVAVSDTTKGDSSN